MAEVVPGQSYTAYGGYRPSDGKAPEGFPYHRSGVYFRDEKSAAAWVALRNDLRNAQRAGFPRTVEGLAAYRKRARQNREDRAFNAYQRQVERMARDYIRRKYGITHAIPPQYRSELRDRVRRLMTRTPFTGPKPGR